MIEGDIVKLKSGGVPMIVSIVHKVFDYPEVFTCVWMDKIGNVHRDAFDSKLLIKVQ